MTINLSALKNIMYPGIEELIRNDAKFRDVSNNSTRRLLEALEGNHKQITGGFIGANLTNMNIEGKDLSRANIPLGNWLNANVIDSHMPQNMPGSTLNFVNLQKSNAAEGDWRASHIGEVRFDNDSNATGLNLSHANVYGPLALGDDNSAKKLLAERINMSHINESMQHNDPSDVYITNANAQKLNLDHAKQLHLHTSQSDLRQLQADQAALTTLGIYNSDIRGLDLPRIQSQAEHSRFFNNQTI